MNSQWTEAIGSVNGYVHNLPESTKIVVAVFDSISHDVIRNTMSNDWRDISSEEVSPRGGTPLFDSAARMMWRIMDDNSERAIFVTMTDGEENQSKYFKQSDVKAITKALENKKYEVIFLGANFEKVGVSAAAFGLADDKFANITTRNLNQYMTGTVAAHSTDYLVTGKSMTFSEADKKTAVK
jgi:hypothetical protein